MAITRSWKVYGRDGHRQRMSFGESFKWDFSNEKDGTRIIEVLNADKTGTNEYSILRITRDTLWELDREYEGQLSDGVFENYNVGHTEIFEDNTPALNITVKNLVDACFGIVGVGKNYEVRIYKEWDLIYCADDKIDDTTYGRAVKYFCIDEGEFDLPALCIYI